MNPPEDDSVSTALAATEIPAHTPLTRSVGQVAREALTQPGRISGIIATATPTVAFVATDALTSLYPALGVAIAIAIMGAAWRIRRRQSMRHALAGVLIVAVCAAIAAATGQERGFFLIPTLVPFLIIMVCLISVLARRPVAGLILNRILRGPPGWPRNDQLRRVYLISTLSYAGVNVALGTVQAILYLANESAILAAVHVAAAPLFVIIIAATVVFARRVMADTETP
jgi:hypothetical protein